MTNEEINAAIIKSGNNQYNKKKDVALCYRKPCQSEYEPRGRLLTDEELALVDAKACRDAHADGMLLVWWFDQQSIGRLDLTIELNEGRFQVMDPDEDDEDETPAPKAKSSRFGGLFPRVA